MLALVQLGKDGKDIPKDRGGGGSEPPDDDGNSGNGETPNDSKRHDNFGLVLKCAFAVSTVLALCEPLREMIAQAVSSTPKDWSRFNGELNTVLSQILLVTFLVRSVILDLVSLRGKDPPQKFKLLKAQSASQRSRDPILLFIGLGFVLEQMRNTFMKVLQLDVVNSELIRNYGIMLIAYIFVHIITHESEVREFDQP